MVEVAGDGAILSEGVDASLASALARRGARQLKVAAPNPHPLRWP